MTMVMGAPSGNTDSQILQYYLDRLNEAQKAVLLSMAKAFATEQEASKEVYSDAFVAELDRRTGAYKNGTSRGVTAEESKQRIAELLKG